ncbi:MAG: DUF1902 domain-containing protein [Caulobacteraceae bacterium]
MSLSYYVEAIWDPEHKVWCSESNIPGLVIETATLDEFEALVRHFAPELLAENVGHEAVQAPIEFRSRSILHLSAA